MHNKFMRRGAVAALAGLALLGAATAGAHAEEKKYRIALSNSYNGNEWRVEMINLLHAYRQKYLADKVELTVNSSGPDVQKQIAAIQDMISQKVDAIIIDPVSPAALNPVIGQAVKRGIVVVVFDQNVSSPAPYQITTDFTQLGAMLADWVAKTVGGKGNVILNRGVAGFEADTSMHQGMVNALAKYPDIKVVTEVYGRWDDGVTQTEMTKALLAHPDIQGVASEGGEYGVLQALLNLKHPLNVAIAGEGQNGWRIAMAKYADQGLKGMSAGESTVSGIQALRIAVDALDGHPPAVKSQRINIVPITTQDLKEGVNYYAAEPANFTPDLDIPGTNIRMAVEDALGKK